MEKLATIIKEITLSNKLQLNSYRSVVEARIQIEKSIRQSQIEYSKERNNLAVLASKRKRDNNGELITKMTIYNLSLQHQKVVDTSMETLARIQELELMMLGVLNAKNIDFIDAEELEGKEVIGSQ